MKRVILFLSLLILTNFHVLPAQAASGEVVFPLGQNSYQVDGLQRPMDAQVIVEGGRIYVPIRYLAEALEAEVRWIPHGDKPGLIVLAKGQDGVVFRMDKSDYTVIKGPAASLLQMDVTPLSREGRIYLPARYVTNVFGYSVTFNEADQTMRIAQSNLPAPSTDKLEYRIEDLVKDETLLRALLHTGTTLYILMP